MKRDRARWLVDGSIAHYMQDGVSLCGVFKHKRLAWMHTANVIRSYRNKYTLCVECEKKLDLL